jgi:acetoin utilization deacetylase AcuC-like enzyme
MLGDPWRANALGPLKAKPVLASLKAANIPIEVVPPEPATRKDLHRAHAPGFVDAILECRAPNAFGTRSDEFAAALPHVCGSMHTAGVFALERGVAASLSCGFHHAGFAKTRSYCTFNGLIVAALKLLHEKRVERIFILDCDYHYGDGTQALIEHHGLSGRIHNESLGDRFRTREQAVPYLDELRNIGSLLRQFRPDLILYQAGVDAHMDDPLGGLLDDAELSTRERIVFGHALDLGIPIAWNLAGGYQKEPDGSYPKVVARHVNTFSIAQDVFLGSQEAQPSLGEKRRCAE